MRKTIKFFIFTLAVGLLLMPGFAQVGGNGGIAADKAQKAIAIVLDDSGSMVHDNTAQVPYNTRWVEADYSVRALAAMMDNGDILRVYPLNEEGYFSATIGKDNLEEVLFDKLESMDYSGGTYFNQVGAAAEFLKGVERVDRYLVVITDGVFQNDDNSKMTQGQLDNAINGILTPSIKMHYIQIGQADNNRVPSNSAVSVHYSSTQKITKQITDVINQIYHRVAMQDEDKEALITSSPSDGLTVSFNIPVKNATIFLQGNMDWDRSTYSAADYSIKSTKITAKKKNTLKLWGDLGANADNLIKTIPLSGLVINCEAPDTGSMESVSVSGVPGLDKEIIQVYYEPAVEQQITIMQRGGESFVYGRMDPPLFVEGPVDIAVDYCGLNGETLNPNTASMLRAGSAAVEVNGRLFNAARQEDGRYVYSGSLSAADAGSSIVISNDIGLEGGAWFIPLEAVYEPNKALTLGLALDSPKLTLDSAGRAVLLVSISDEISGAPTQWTAGMEIECTSEYFHAETGNLACEDGMIQIPLVLKDVDEHQIGGTERFTVKVSIPYSDSIRAPASQEKTLPPVEITSEPHELSAELENASAKLSRVFVGGQTFPVVYLCDGKPLTVEQRKDAEVSLTLQDPALSKLVTLRDGDIRLRARTLQWLNIRGEEYEGELTVSYTKWNQPVQVTVPIKLNLSPITGLQILGFALSFIVFIALLGFLVWFALWFFIWTKNGDYINWNTVFELVDSEDPQNSTTLKWVRHSKILFRAKFWGTRYAHIQRHTSNEGDAAPLPGSIDFFIRREENGWILGKIDTRMRPRPDEPGLQIGGAPVSSGNCCFSAGDRTQKGLEIQRCGHKPWYLKITENE